MGNNKSKKEISHVEELLALTYLNTEIEFSFKEITSFKLRFHDAENYFHTKFDFFFFFNNYFFRERLSTLYDNFNTKIEKFSKWKSKPIFNVLIDFDDESENISRGLKIDFDSLFTIIFERLEILTILFFDMTNVDIYYISDFFAQLIESVDLYKYNRKFDCLYFLLPNTDYYVKNDCGILYITNKSIHNKKIFFDDQIIEITNEYLEAINFNSDQEKLLNSKYPSCEVNYYIEYFLEKISPTLIKVHLTVNFQTEIESLIINNENMFKLVEVLIETCAINIVYVQIDSFICYNLLEIVVKKLINLLDKSKLEENVLILKVIMKNKNKSNDRLFNLYKIKLTIQNLIRQFTEYNMIQNKRKFIIEFYNITIPIIQNSYCISTNRSSNSATNLSENNNKLICSLSYEKLFFYWFLNTQNRTVDLKFCFGILLKKELFKKLNDIRIISNIKAMLFNNFTVRYTKENSKILYEDIIKI